MTVHPSPTVGLIALCSGMPWVVTARFVGSFLRYHPLEEGHAVVLIVRSWQTDDGFRTRFREMCGPRGELVEISEGEPDASEADSAWWSDFHCQNARWKTIADYLEKESGRGGDRPTLWLASDARDVIFQGSVGRALRATMQRDDAPLHVFEEDIVGAHCSINRAWVELLIPGEEHSAIREKVLAHPVLCSGTILGLASGLAECARAMERVLLNAPHENRRFVLDQAALNVVVRSGGSLSSRLPIQIHRNCDNGIVLTLAQRTIHAMFRTNPEWKHKLAGFVNAGTFPAHTFDASTGKMLANDRGDVTSRPPVVHQWDRFVLSSPAHCECCVRPFLLQTATPISDMDRSVLSAVWSSEGATPIVVATQ